MNLSGHTTKGCAKCFGKCFAYMLGNEIPGTDKYCDKQTLANGHVLQIDWSRVEGLLVG